MSLKFETELAVAYESASQKIRVLSESWACKHVYCPSCGYQSIQRRVNNRPVSDFYCLFYGEDYELKSKKGRFGKSITDGAYKTMLERLNSNDKPNLFLLNYSVKSYSVINLIVVPKQFFVSRIIEQRKPLSPLAQRAGWIGCNIMLEAIPISGRIYLIRDGLARSKTEVVLDWQRTSFLRDQKSEFSRGWLIGVMKCIEEMRKDEFSLQDIYRFENRLSAMYPNNNHIREKIRQQLQLLRDNGYLRFVSRGRYLVTLFRGQI